MKTVPMLTPYLLVALSCIACGGTDQSRELTAVDVAEQPVLDPTSDPVATSRPRALIGILPADFPADVTLYLPASLVDFDNSQEVRWVKLFTPSPVSTVHPALTELLQSNGWRVTNSTQERLTASKGTRKLTLSIQDALPGTEYRIEYSG